MFGPRLLHTTNIVFKNVPPPLGAVGPLLRNPGEGPAANANTKTQLTLICKFYFAYKIQQNFTI